jgi:hypothetical protein
MLKRPQAEETTYRLRTTLVQSLPESEARDLQLRREQVTPLGPDGREERVRDLLIRLRQEAPTAYLAAMTVIESFVRREVQQRYLDDLRSSHDQDSVC